MPVTAKYGWGTLDASTWRFSVAGVAPFIPNRNGGWAISVLAGPRGAGVRHMRVDQFANDPSSNYIWSMYLVRGQVPADVSALTFGQSIWMPPPAPKIAAASLGLDLLYFHSIANANTIPWPNPGMNVFFKDGLGPRVAPGEWLTMLLVPSFIAGAGAAANAVLSHCSITMLGGDNVDYVPRSEGGRGLDGLRSIPRGGF